MLLILVQFLDGYGIDILAVVLLGLGLLAQHRFMAIRVIQWLLFLLDAGYILRREGFLLVFRGFATTMSIVFVSSLSVFTRFACIVFVG